jgi:hypothetical protein
MQNAPAACATLTYENRTLVRRNSSQRYALVPRYGDDLLGHLVATTPRLLHSQRPSGWLVTGPDSFAMFAIGMVALALIFILAALGVGLFHH